MGIALSPIIAAVLLAQAQWIHQTSWTLLVKGLAEGLVVHYTVGWFRKNIGIKN